MPGARVLIVEDEAIVAEDIAHSLEQSGYVVAGRVATGREAIDLTASSRPDLVLMDVKLRGGMGGVEAAAIIGREYEVPVVFLTAFADENTVVQAADSGAFGYLVKPFDPQELRSAVEMALYRHDMERELRASEARYRAIVEEQTEMLCRFRVDGTVTYANKAFCQYFGWRPQSVEGRSLFGLMAELGNESFVDRLRALQPGREVVTVELPTHHPDGDRWSRWSYHAIHDDSGRLVEYQAAGHDRSKRKEAELRLRERQRFIEALNDLTRAALEVDDLASFLQMLADRMGNLFEADGCYVTLLDLYTGKVIPGTAMGNSQSEYSKLQIKPGQLTMTESVLTAGRPLLISDAANSPYVDVAITAEFPHRSYLALPLMRGEDKLGAILVGYTEPHQFTVQEVTQGEQAAALAALALARTFLLEQSETRRKEAETLREATAAVSQVRGLDRTLEVILEQLERVLPYDSASIQLLHDDYFEVVHGRGFDNPGKIIGQRFDLESTNVNEHLLETQQPLIISDVRQTQMGFNQQPHQHIRSWLGAPLQVGERLIGMMTVDSKQPNHFRPEHIALVAPFANQAAIAIENARLVQQLEETAEQQTAEARREQEMNAVILHSVSDAIALLDLELRIQYVNPTFVTLTGFAEDEAMGQRLNELLSCNLELWQGATLHSAVVRGDRWQHETMAQRKDGRPYTAALALSPVRDAKGNLTGYVASHRDVSRRHELATARQGFIGNVSHQMRTPVTTIKLYTELLSRMELNDKMSRYIDILLEQEERLIALIQDIVRMAELESGRSLSVWRPVHADGLFHDLVQAYRQRAEDRGIQLIEEAIPADLPPIMGDRNRILKALNEIVENALLFVPMGEPGDRLILRSELVEQEDGHWVTISLEDNGPGISPEEQLQIFEPFFRGELASSGHEPGTGLGLSMAWQIIQSHGGRITVTSEVGKGSTFTVWLSAD